MLPLHHPSVVTVESIGVLTGAKPTWLKMLWWSFTGRVQTYTGFIVPFDLAIDRVEGVSPDAAAWWRGNCRHLAGQGLVFEAEVCRVV